MFQCQSSQWAGSPARLGRAEQQWGLGEGGGLQTHLSRAWRHAAAPSPGGAGLGDTAQWAEGVPAGAEGGAEGQGEGGGGGGAAW